MSPLLVTAATSPAPVTTRDRLLDAAARVIVRDGYQGARLADVAREAGLTTGAVYSNFRNKEELFVAAFDRLQAARQRVLLPADESRTFAGTMAAMVQMLNGLVRSHDLRVLTFELGLLATRDERVAGELKRGFAETLQAVVGVLPLESELQAAGVPLGREELGTVILALFNGLSLVAMFDPVRVTDEVAERSIRALSGGLTGGSEPDKLARRPRTPANRVETHNTRRKGNG